MIGNAGDDPGTGAIPAIGGTTVGDEKEDAIGIAMDEAGDGHVGVFATRVGHFGGVGVGLFDPGNDLTTNGAIGIRGVDQVEEVGRDRGGKLGAGQEDAGALLFGEGEVFLDLFEGGHPVFQLPLGRIPVFGRHVFIGPVTWGGGCEGYLAQISGIVGQF